MILLPPNEDILTIIARETWETLEGKMGFLGEFPGLRKAEEYRDDLEFILVSLVYTAAGHAVDSLAEAGYEITKIEGED